MTDYVDIEDDVDPEQRRSFAQQLMFDAHFERYEQMRAQHDGLTLHEYVVGVRRRAGQ